MRDNLPYMTGGQFRRVRWLVKKCANYDNGSCLPLDDGDTCPCPQTLTRSLVCKYFKAAVLPEDEALYSEIMGQTSRKLCLICGAPIYSKSNAAKFCPHCARRERRRQDRERKQNNKSANKGPETR